MSEAITPRWIRYEEGLITALGCAGLEGHPAATGYRRLIHPTFHAAGCLEFLFLEKGSHFRLAALPSAINPIFEHIWNEDTKRAESAIMEAMFSCLETTVMLDDAAAADYRARLSALPTPSVQAADLAARDGIQIRLDYRGDRPETTLRAQLASVSASTDLAPWISLFLDTAQALCRDQRLLAYLAKVRSYFFRSA